MGYFCSITESTFEQGPLDFSKENAADASANVILHNGVLQTEAIFQILLLVHDPLRETPYQITMMSPERYTYVEFDRETFRQAVMDRGLHQHNTYELVYIREGSLYQRIESERHCYPTGSLVLLNRNVRHSEEYESAFSTVSLSLSAEYFKHLIQEDKTQAFKTARLWGENTDLQEFLSAELLSTGSYNKSYIDFIPRSPHTPKADAIGNIFEKLTRILLAPTPGDFYFFRGTICQLLNLLCRKDLFTTHPIALGTEAESRIFSQITQLIEEYNGRISRELLVEKLCYSGSYLNRIVQTFTGRNITQYALDHVLKKAAWLLCNTDVTVTELIAGLGFSNRSYFYVEFEKRYGLTPRQYRGRNRLGK